MGWCIGFTDVPCSILFSDIVVCFVDPASCFTVCCAWQVKYHEDFEKSKGSFTPTISDPITERVKRNTQDFSDISYRGIQRRVVEMERRRAEEHDQETTTGELIHIGTCTQTGPFIQGVLLHLWHTGFLPQTCVCGAQTLAPSLTMTLLRTISSPGVFTWCQVNDSYAVTVLVLVSCGYTFIFIVEWRRCSCNVDIFYGSVQAQRRSKEHSRSTSAMSGVGDEKSEVSENVDHHTSLYSNGFGVSSFGMNWNCLMCFRFYWIVIIWCQIILGWWNISTILII